MSNAMRVISFRASTNFSRNSSAERVKTIKCGVGKEGFSQRKDLGKRVNMVNSVEISSDLKMRNKQCLMSPSKAVLVSASSAVEVAPDYNWVTRAKHFFMILVKRALIAMKLIKISLKKSAQFQMVLEKAIIDCRFFTFFAIAGSLLGSVLCFVEGCLFIIKSYMQYLHTLSHKADQGHVMHLLIEAIDMYLVGTALLIFGVGFYTMFVGSREKGSWLPGSNLFGLFHMKGVPSWVEMHSICHAKSKLGHAVVMILQVGVLEKFQNVPLATGFDLACFAGTLLISSASIFVLSKLSFGVPH